VHPAVGVDDRIRIAGRPHLATPDRMVIVHRGAIEETLDRLPPGDSRTRARLPAQKPAQLRRLRHLAHALDALGEPCAIITSGVTEIAVIDHKPVVEAGAGQAHAPARERRQARGSQNPVPLRGVLATAADWIDMQVETLPASARRELRNYLLVRSPACFRLVALHLLDQLSASFVEDLQTRLIMQVASDAGEVQRGLDPDGDQLAGGSDTGPEQDRGAPVGASGEHHPRRADFRQPLAIPHGHADSAAVADKDPLDRSIAGHDEPITDRVHIRERAVDAVTPVDVDGKGGNAGVLVQVVEVLHRGDLARHDRIPADALERGQLIKAHAPHPQLFPRRGEQREKFARRPARVARGGPAVVIGTAPEHHGTGIVRGAATDHTRPVEADHLAAELAGVAPVVGPLRGARGVEKVVRPAAAIGRAVVWAGFQEQRAPGATRREAAGHHRTGCSSADDNGVHCLGEARRDAHADPPPQLSWRRTPCISCAGLTNPPS
jgi:hypothetical protein